MTVELLDGRKVSKEILSKIKQDLLSKKISPKLSIILCGNDPASLMYTSMKKNKAKSVGIIAEVINFEVSINEEELIKNIKRIQDQSDGVMVQLPLPVGLDKNNVLKSIDPLKDVDGLTSTCLGKVLFGDEKLAPATPKGIITLLDYYGIDIKGKNVVIINHSNVVGKPLAMMFLNRGATVTVCHEFTQDLPSHTKKADILVIGIGKPNFITNDMVKNNSVIVDVGISKIGGNIVGDVDFESVKEKVSFITPVPGGVGPMTVATLLDNVLNTL